MSEVCLDRAGVLTIGRQLEAAAVAQHVAMDQEAKPCCLASANNHALIAARSVASHAQKQTRMATAAQGGTALN